MIEVLLVEDNDDLRDDLVFQLNTQGFHAQGVATGQAMDDHLQLQTPDIFVLDLGLPDEDGLSIAQRLRSHCSQSGIVILTARSALKDRITGHERGATTTCANRSTCWSWSPYCTHWRAACQQKPPAAGYCINASNA